MTAESMKVLWPERLALVCKKTDPGVLEKDIKGYDEVAYEMGYAKEEIVWGKVEVNSLWVSKDLIALEHEYTCPIHNAYYLARVVVRPLDGKMLPKGSLCVRVDREAVAQGPLSSFLPDPGPIDYEKPFAWEKNDHVYRACVKTDEGAWPNRRLGFMLPSGSKVSVHLNDITPEEAMTLEVGIVTALYSTKIGEITKPKVEA